MIYAFLCAGVRVYLSEHNSILTVRSIYLKFDVYIINVPVDFCVCRMHSLLQECKKNYTLCSMESNY